MRKKGFTLIELSVVITIIALLSIDLSILMPSLKKVKYLAMRLQGTTNINSQAIIFKLYAKGGAEWLTDRLASLSNLVADFFNLLIPLRIA